MTDHDGTNREEISFPAEKEEVEAVQDDVDNLRERVSMLDKLVNKLYRETDVEVDEPVPHVLPENREESEEPEEPEEQG